MKKIIFCFISISIFLLSTCVISNALSEQEYNNLMKKYQIVKELDKELNSTWKFIVPYMTPEGKKVLLNDQRDWLKNRESYIKKYLDDKPNMPRALAIANILFDRIDYLTCIGLQTVPGESVTYSDAGYVDGPAIPGSNAKASDYE